MLSQRPRIRLAAHHPFRVTKRRAGRSSTPRSSTPWWKRGRAARTRRWRSSHRQQSGSTTSVVGPRRPRKAAPLAADAAKR